MLKAAEFAQWTENAKPGERVVYYVGELDQDRTRFPTVAALSDTAYGLGEAAWYRMSNCQHMRGVAFGENKVLLTQVRRETGPGFVYVAERK
jgi:hypothetical protein